MPYQSKVNCMSHIQSIVDAIDLKNVSLHNHQGVSADQLSTSVHTSTTNNYVVKTMLLHKQMKVLLLLLASEC